MSIRHFALVYGSGASKEKPSGIFRAVQEADSYTLERLDRFGQWVMDMELSRYLFQGEPGAVELFRARFEIARIELESI